MERRREVINFQSLEFSQIDPDLGYTLDHKSKTLLDRNFTL